MKSIFSLRALVLLAGVLAPGLVSAASDQAFHGALIGLPVTGTSGTMTYALSSKTNTVVSSVIDMRTFGGMYVTVTGTAGAGGAEVQFTNLSWSATTWSTAAVVPVNGNQPVRKHGSWARFRAIASGVTAGGVSGTVTAFYEPVAEAVNPAAAAGTNIIGAVGVTSTTYTSWTIASVASYSLTGTTAIDLATVAGSGRIFKYKITALGPNAGFYHGTASNSTWVGPLGYYAVSTTPVIDDYLTTGTYLNLSATAAAMTVTVQVEISKLTQVVP